MFANRIRNAALALAGATFLATALTTTIAAAPVAPGRVEHIRQIKLPGTFRHADLVVPPLGLAADAAVQNVEYRFRVTNNGPDTMTFKYDGRATWAVSRQDNGDQYGPSGYATRSPGESIDLVVPCHISGDPSHYCAKRRLRVEPVYGFDTNASNDIAHVFSGFVD